MHFKCLWWRNSFCAIFFTTVAHPALQPCFWNALYSNKRQGSFGTNMICLLLAFWCFVLLFIDRCWNCFVLFCWEILYCTVFCHLMYYLLFAQSWDSGHSIPMLICILIAMYRQNVVGCDNYSKGKSLVIKNNVW